MTDTTDAALNQLKFVADCCIENPDSIYASEFFLLLDEIFGKQGDYSMPVQAVAVSHLIWLLEAERQRVKELTETAGRWPDPLEHPAIKALQSGDIFNPEVLSVFDKLAREIQAHRNYRRFDYMEELPKKPVALPKSHYVCGCADRYMSGKEVKAAIEASGDIVKEGE